MSKTWFVRQRQEWIAETLEIFGFIQREHITKKFGVSVPQASLDLREFITENPDAVIYNKTTKRYEVRHEGNDDRHPSRRRDNSRNIGRAA